MYTHSALAAERRRRKRRTLLLGATAAALAALLLAGGLLVWPGSGDSDGTDPRAATAQAPDEPAEDTPEERPVSPEGALTTGISQRVKGKGPLYTPGTWITRETIVKGIADKLAGYSFGDDDSPKWTLPLGGHLCAVSRHLTRDGRTAVVVDSEKWNNAAPGGVCDQLLLVDLDTGRELWRKRLPGAGLATVTNINVTLVKGVVAVAWEKASAAFDMRDGRRLWAHTATSACKDTGFTGGRALLFLVSCGDPPDVAFQVRKLNPRTGRTEWAYKVAEGISRVYLPSSDPPVLALAAGDLEISHLISLDDRGRYRTTVSLDGFETGCDGGPYDQAVFGVLDRCATVVVGGDTAYVTSESGSEAGMPANRIVGFDLGTGRTTKKFDGREGQPVYPVRMNGDELLVLRQGLAVAHTLGALLGWNPKTDEETPYLYFSVPEDDTFALRSRVDVLYGRGRLVLAKREVERNEDYAEDAVLYGYGSPGLKH